MPVETMESKRMTEPSHKSTFFRQSGWMVASAAGGGGVTVAVGVVMLWFRIFQGLLQGRQNFLWLGWGGIFNGVGRVVIIGMIVTLFHGGAAGGMGGVLIGLLVASGIGIWQNLDLRKE